MQFYIYIDGFDLDDCAEHISERILDFITPYGERIGFVNKREPSMGGSDLPVWNLGVNFYDDTLSESEKSDLIFFFHQLSSESGREFILGGRRGTDMPEDYISISPQNPIEAAIELVTELKK